MLECLIMLKTCLRVFFLKRLNERLVSTNIYVNTSVCVFIITETRALASDILLVRLLALRFLTVTCSCCQNLYFGSAIILVTYFNKF